MSLDPRTEMLNDRHVGHLVGDEKQVRKNRGIFAVQPMENLDRRFNLNAARQVKKCAG